MGWNRDKWISAIWTAAISIAILSMYFIPPPRVAKREFPLLDAIKAGDIEQVRILLTQGEDPNSRETQYTYRWWFRSVNLDIPREMATTALMLAASSGRKDIVELLLESGAEIGARTFSGATALQAAIAGDGPLQIEIVKLLVDRGADVNSTGDEPPLMTASSMNRTDMVKFLLSRGADVNARDEEGFTVLMEPAGSGYEEVVVILIAAGIDIHAGNKEGFTALHYAREQKQPRMVDLLVAAGARE